LCYGRLSVRLLHFLVKRDYVGVDAAQAGLGFYGSLLRTFKELGNAFTERLDGLL
jgi:hypothetical protein